ncbi:DUF4214 domain-containing protein [Halomonas sabkhae]|uniref:DUF4214 domain-containing protein n=1 Tax=Halomonas sabkhae TaxID=626223 RepID=UPI0025B5CA55|nr:DUF4214 domain-containing protein [Halomonas sabkhae]MDN3524167.1 DUF4214 domain-containing protein [Halomonas sabkhae]
MATQDSIDLVQKLYVAYYGRPADSAGQTFWAEKIDNEGADAVINDFGNSAEYESRFGDLGNEELVNNLYQQLFGRDAEQDGLDFYTGKLESGELSLADIALVIAENAENADADVMANKVAAAQSFTTEAGDDYAGDAAADYASEFLGGVNADTDVANLDVSSVVADIPASQDGGGDGDTGQPTDTTDINFITSGTGQGGFEIGENGQLNWVPGTGEGGEDVYEADVDGELSQVDLNPNVQQVINIGKAEWDEAGQVATTSKDYTFNLTDQLNQAGEVEQYEGLFLSPLLTAEDRTANSQLFIDLLDLRTAGTDRPLGDLPVNGFRFTLDGEEVVIESEEIFQAETYPQLLTAVQDALANSEDARLEDFSASLGGQFTAQDEQGNTQTGTTLVLTDGSGGAIEQGNFTYSDDASAGGFTLYGEQSTEAPENIQELIETNLDLDNVGYGSQGGSVNLVGQSNSDKGIEQMNVNATNGVWLTRLESNSSMDFLKEINLEGNGYFKVGSQDGQNVHGLEDLFMGTGQVGLMDVQDLNGGDFGGDIKISAEITEEVIGRDLDATDDDVDPKSDNATFNYTTANGDDQVSLALSSNLMAREDANVVVDSGAGDDVVETLISNNLSEGNINDLSDQQLNANQTISTGAGNDVVTTWGQGDAVIGTGSGGDVIYADNSGLLTGNRDRWEFNSTAAAGAAPNGQSNSDVELSNGASDVAQTFTVNTAAEVQVLVDFKGFGSGWVDVPSSNGEISTLQVNQAIKDAVNNNHVLSNLIEASDGDGNILNIESLIDDNNLDQLAVSFRDQNDNNPSDLTGIEDIYSADAAAQGGPGVASTAESDNTIDAGAGNDVVVLGTGSESNDTLLLSDSFGRDAVVNFTAGEGAGHDILDFTSYAVNNGTVGNDLDVDNNEVNVLDFAAGDYGNGVSFANLSAQDVQGAISGVENGRVDSIVMVENGDSGVYKAFDVNSTANSTDATATMIGTLDFGASQDFVDANIA